MREIKFRAWDQATMDHWEPKPQGMVFFFTHNVPNFIGHTFNENQGKWERRFIVEQFTGLQDLNGVDIYEGDIVSAPYVDPLGGLHTNVECYKTVVSFERGSFVVDSTDSRAEKMTIENWIERSEGHYVSNYGNITNWKGCVLKVIGNIHENPELKP